jgi:predicted lipoprotein with Yx(FWY)xxD motif
MTYLKFHMARAALVVGAVAILVTACGSGGGGSSSGSADMSSGLVSTSSVDGSSTFADAAGKTLYSADVEANGQIKCVDSCTTFWQPLMATVKQAKQASTRLGVTFGVVDRPDGETQLTFRDLPLYTFAEEGVGQLTGNGFTDDFQGTHFEWSAVGADGSAAPSPSTNRGGGYGY